MDTAATILIVYGTVSLAGGFLLGLPLSQARNAAPIASHHLVTAHLSAIIQGAAHLGLSAAMAFSRLPELVETTAAVLLAAGSALFVAGAVANWRQDIGDHFAVRSVGWRLLATSSACHLPGMGIVLVGVLAAL